MKKTLLTCALTALFLLAGCFGHSGQANGFEGTLSSEPSSTESVSVEEPEPELPAEPLPEPDTVFSPLTSQREGALEEAISWVTEEKARINAMETLPEAQSVAAVFAQANEAYKAGDYELAYVRYGELLTQLPTHSGALNNMTLACLQLEKEEEALRYSILCGVQHPDFHGSRVNMLVALHALGYPTADAMSEIEEAEIGYPPRSEFFEHFDTDEDTNPILNAFLYNTCYNAMEAEILEKGDPELNDQDLMRLAAGEITEEELSQEQLQWWLDTWNNALTHMHNLAPEDEDYRLLIDYLEQLETLRRQ